MDTLGSVVIIVSALLVSLGLSLSLIIFLIVRLLFPKGGGLAGKTGNTIVKVVFFGVISKTGTGLEDRVFEKVFDGIVPFSDGAVLTPGEGVVHKGKRVGIKLCSFLGWR